MPAQNNAVKIEDARTLADGVRDFSVTYEQPTVDIESVSGWMETIPVGQRRYHVEVRCNEAIFAQLFNIIMRDSKNAPDLFTQFRHVEVPE